MTKKDKIEFWIKSAESDFEAATILFDNNKYEQMSFFCHLTIEKYLKAYYFYSVDDEPPYIHNLIKLSQLSGLYDKLNNESKELLSLLMPLNIKGRYPDESDISFSMLKKENYENIFHALQEFIKWIKKQMIL